MADIEKVKQGVKACWTEHWYHRCFDCPYKPDRENDNTCVERLGADALELLKEQRWIPITERLPKEKETVLLSDGYDVLYGYITTKRDFILVDEALSKDNFLIKSKQHWGISHWMPLPKIPKDGEQE